MIFGDDDDTPRDPQTPPRDDGPQDEGPRPKLTVVK
jgi:hypothetical protein